MQKRTGRLLEFSFALCMAASPAAFAAGAIAMSGDPLQTAQPRPAQTVPAMAGGEAPLLMQQSPGPGQVQIPGQGQGQVPIPDRAPGGQPLSGTSGQPPAGPGPLLAPLPGQPQAVLPPGLPPVLPPPGNVSGATGPMGEIPKPFHGTMSFEAGNGKILTLTLPAANIYVADPKVAEVRPASSTSLFVFGVGPGHTTIAAVDGFGRLLADYNITVRPTAFAAREVQDSISRMVPGGQIQVRPVGKGLVLTGAVRTPIDAQHAVAVAKAYVPDGGSVDNQMTISAPDQVTLMVRIAEMKRSVARNLGINWDAAVMSGKILNGLGAPFTAIFNSAACTLTTLTPGSSTRGACTDAVLQALAKDGLAHILAEPNLTVMSGQRASFHSGGEYPIIITQSSGGTTVATIEYKPYGVMLSFLPTVLNDGRINLHVKPEVSNLDTSNTALTVTSGSSTQIIPYLTVRRAETTVELGSGETYAIAGMLNTVSSDANSGIPGLSETPVLGALFNANTLQREQTELVIIVTPLLSRALKNMAQVQLPGDGYYPQSDGRRLLLLRQTQNRDGTTQQISAGQAGFMVR